MHNAKDPDGKELTQEQTIDALLQRIVAYAVVLKRQLKEEDYKALQSLRPFLKAADRLITEIGYQDKR